MRVYGVCVGCIGPWYYALLTSRRAVLSGEASAVLIADESADPSRFGALVQSVSAVSRRGKRIELSAYIAVENAPDGASIWMRADDAAGNVVAFDNSMTRGIRGTATWTYQNIVMDVPPGAAVLLYGAVLNGKGVLYVDNVQLTQAGNDVPATARQYPRAPSTVTAIDVTRLPPEPRNLDFEQTILPAP